MTQNNDHVKMKLLLIVQGSVLLRVVCYNTFTIVIIKRKNGL